MYLCDESGIAWMSFEEQKSMGSHLIVHDRPWPVELHAVASGNVKKKESILSPHPIIERMLRT